MRVVIFLVLEIWKLLRCLYIEKVPPNVHSINLGVLNRIAPLPLSSTYYILFSFSIDFVEHRSAPDLGLKFDLFIQLSLLALHELPRTFICFIPYRILVVPFIVIFGKLHHFYWQNKISNKWYGVLPTKRIFQPFRLVSSRISFILFLGKPECNNGRSKIQNILYYSLLSKSIEYCLVGFNIFIRVLLEYCSAILLLSIIAFEGKQCRFIHSHLVFSW